MFAGRRSDSGCEDQCAGSTDDAIAEGEAPQPFVDERVAVPVPQRAFEFATVRIEGILFSCSTNHADQPIIGRHQLRRGGLLEARDLPALLRLAFRPVLEHWADQDACYATVYHHQKIRRHRPLCELSWRPHPLSGAVLPPWSHPGDRATQVDLCADLVADLFDDAHGLVAEHVA